jgi:hypothetical protein
MVAPEELGKGDYKNLSISMPEVDISIADGNQ